MAHEEVNDEKVVEFLLQSRKALSRGTLAELVKVARASGGTVVAPAYDPDGGDWCGTGVKFPWPPKKLDAFLDFTLRHHAILEVFPYGIVAPDEVLIRIKGMKNVER